MRTVTINQQVPDFIVPATNNKNVRLSALKGYNVILYFYPKDATPGCTIESQDFAANYNSFRATNTLVFGVSRDSLESHEQFKAAQILPFELISDENQALSALFGVIKPRTLKDQTFMGMIRSTFLIDSDGILRKEWRDISVKEHVHEVLAYCQRLSEPGLKRTNIS
ncbi:peroxiredoxin [Gynuella sunshinyii]|uniref:thioredoxin-dependent peroxiredoxin n=1 Tax=Gynuella sunshinyii YC6258 TaxID=1445510 RepID=A0A0C5V5A1_9GAMM|nr:peroxiredoxin [Gynuella sunshinyii]AJQ94630.1 peroxiredoxin [Gynuella sunshinyii YC6258]